MSEPPSWKAIAARKQAERLSRIPSGWRLDEATLSVAASATCVLDVPRKSGILSARELEITETEDATMLLEDLLAKRRSSVEVVTAFCKRAAIAQQVTNCLTEIFFTAAIARAESLDAHYARTGAPLGPLHGLPISIKDTFRVRGQDASLGTAALCFKPSATNSTLVDLLLAAGAVLYCKTNLPQAIMALDSNNNVFGRTLNPLNRRLTAGGSSGGEGPLVALRGSPIGIGTDIGGSVRVPAMCNGLYALKPSHGRVPYAGQASAEKAGSEAVAVRASVGCIARSVRDCELLFRVVSEMRAWEWDTEVVPQSWDMQIGLSADMHGMPGARPLRIGVVRSDGVTMPLPPMERFMDEVVAVLRRARPGDGVPAIETVEVDASGLLKRCIKGVNAAFGIEGANGWMDLLEATDEPLVPWNVGRIKRKPQYSLERVKEVQATRTALQTESLQMWKGASGDSDASLDAIICHVAPHPVPEIDRWNTAGYTSSWVFLDCPAATLPVRKMTNADLEGEIADTKSLSSWDEANRKLWTDVDRKVYLDTPLTLQVVTKKLEDRKLFEVMTVLDKVFKDHRSQPGTERAKL